MVEVSIILPTYNRGKVLSRPINSVLKQTYTNFELIIIDDGSTDNTEEIVKNLSDKRIIYVKNNRRRGVSFVRNQGISLARGNYISFIDSDDAWLPNKLKIQVKAFQKLDKNFGVVYCSAIINMGRKHRVIDYKDLGSGDTSLKILSKWPPLEATLIKRRCFDTVGYFDQNLECGEDIDFLIRVSQQYKFYYVDKPLVLIYPSTDSLSKNWASDLKGRKIRVRKYFNLYLRNPRALSREYLYIGFCYGYTGDIKTCRDYILNAIKTYPYSVRYYLAYVASLSGVTVFNAIIDLINKYKH